MEIKELDKKQLILLTLLITFVVSIATGIVTVSLMNQTPQNVPQTINNIIQRTIEKVGTAETPDVNNNSNFVPINSGLNLSKGDALVSIYSIGENITPEVILGESPVVNNETVVTDNTIVDTIPKIDNELGKGVIISDIGLVLVDSSILNSSLKYKIILNNTEFDAIVLIKYKNGFTILQIKEKIDNIISPEKTN